MHKFDYSFLSDGYISSKLVNPIAEIYSLKNGIKLKKKKFSEAFDALENKAKLESIRSSNEIEGISTKDERFKSLMNNKVIPLNHEEEEIVGYQHSLNEVHTNYDKLDFTRNDILNLHSIMLSLTNFSYADKFKVTNNVIQKTDLVTGEKSVVFTPTPASETEKSMQQLELAYKQARDDYSVNQLLLIPTVILDFLCIYPFSDGNGRISRLLSLLLLYKNGFDACKYISFEGQINKNKNSYYSSLEKSSINWQENKNDYFPFISNFLYTLCSCYVELEKRFNITDDKKATKENRIEAILLNNGIALSKKDILMMLSGISVTTIELSLSNLLKQGKIRKEGSGKATKYRRVLIK